MPIAPYLAYYGDDFTGSTDMLDALARGGVRGILFTCVPSPATLQAYADYSVIGIAGASRAMAPGRMQAELHEAFTALQAVGARVCHYKVCSTFDSAPEVGSIGRAIDVGVSVFGPSTVPILMAVPKLGRYVAFANLFARMGPSGEAYRIDRHPVMSRHPSTPMNEGDLRRHLAKQTARPVHSVDLSIVERNDADMLVDAIEAPGGLVVVDGTSDRHLETYGAALHAIAARRNVFVVGSSGVGYALAPYVRPADDTPAFPPRPSRLQGPTVIASGSCSAVTANQITYAQERGFAVIDIPPEGLAAEPRRRAVVGERLAAEAAPYLAAGRSVIFQSALGPNDSRIEKASAISGANRETAVALGAMVGSLLAKLIRQHELHRVAIAGGDTSSYAAQAMGIDTLEVTSLLAPGAPLCLASGSGWHRPFEIALKGGQIGPSSYFVDLLG